MVPPETLFQVYDREDREYCECNDFLNRFELYCRKVIAPEAVRRYLKAVFQESDQPADQHYLPKSRIFEPQMPVPGKGHKDIRNNQQNNRKTWRHNPFIYVQNSVKCR